ncbi:MAG: hypothetical protein EXR72_21540 [Myxococcales bacterium]|nr:hypothetical protein [Myxococcales bacterium]
MLNILAFDGGPGPLVQIRMIQQIELRHPGFLARVGLLAGTSDGAIMSLYLALLLTQAGDQVDAPTIIARSITFSDAYSKALCRDLQRVSPAIGWLGGAVQSMATVADESTPVARLKAALRLPGAVLKRGWQVSWMGAGADMWNMREFFRGKTPIDQGSELERLLREAFGTNTLGDLTRKVTIVSYDTAEWSPRIYRNFGSDEDRARDLALTLVDVAMSSSALPLLLPIFGGQNDRGYLDGVFAANNPAMSALSMALRHLVPWQSDRNPLEQVTLLSLGVAQSAEEANLERKGGLWATLVLLLVQDSDTRILTFRKDVDRDRYWTDPAYRAEVRLKLKWKGIGQQAWGWFDLLQRPTFFLNMLLHGMNEEVNRQCTRLLREERYHRFKPRIHLARSMFRMIFMRAGMEKDPTVDRCLAPKLDSPTVDDDVNRGRTKKMLAWIAAHWFEDAPTVG